MARGGLPRVPYAPPRWPRAEYLWYAATGFVLASATPISVAALRDSDQYLFRTLEPAHVLLPAAFSGLLLALPMLYARSASAVVCVAVLGGPLAGALAGALTTLVLYLGDHHGLSVANSTLIGAPFGAVFGALLAGPASAGVACRALPAHDAFDRLLVAIGGWLSIFYATAALALGEHELMVLTWVGLAGGAAALVTGSTRQAGRKAWFERVRSGLEGEWVLRDWNAIPNAAQLQPLFGKAALDCDALLVHIGGCPGLPYRGKRAETAVLLAPGPARVD